MATQEASQSIRTPDAELLLSAESEESPEISFVIPTMDEEDGIRETITRAKYALKAVDMTGEIIVSDSSTDRTPEIAREEGARVVTPDRLGYGYAYRYAFQHVRGDYIVIGDGDSTYDFEELPRLLRELRENDADMVLGSRFKGEIKSGAMPPLHKYIGNPVLTAVLAKIYQIDISDAHSGFRVIRRGALEELDLKTNGMEFASEMITAAWAASLKIVDAPITYHKRRGETKLESFKDGWRHLLFLLSTAPYYYYVRASSRE